MTDDREPHAGARDGCSVIEPPALKIDRAGAHLHHGQRAPSASPATTGSAGRCAAQRETRTRPSRGRPGRSRPGRPTSITVPPSATSTAITVQRCRGTPKIAVDQRREDDEQPGDQPGVARARHGEADASGSGSRRPAPRRRRRPPTARGGWAAAAPGRPSPGTRATKRSSRNGSVGYCVSASLTRTKVQPQTAVTISKEEDVDQWSDCGRRGAWSTSAEEQRPGCLFCRVIEHPDDQDADLVVWRPEGALVMLNKFPYNPGHAMVAPAAHMAASKTWTTPQTAASCARSAAPIDVLRGHAQARGLQRRSQHRPRRRRRHPRPRAPSRRAALERRHQLHGRDRRRQGRERGLAADRREAQAGFRRQLTLPPTTVAATPASSTTVMSHSIPGRSAPRSFSMPDRVGGAGRVGAQRRRAATRRARDASQPGAAMSSPPSMPASGSAVSTGASEPKASRAPARSSARHAYEWPATCGHCCRRARGRRPRGWAASRR